VSPSPAPAVRFAWENTLTTAGYAIAVSLFIAAALLLVLLIVLITRWME
jgi:hypothetical protein